MHVEPSGPPADAAGVGAAEGVALALAVGVADALAVGVAVAVGLGLTVAVGSGVAAVTTVKRIVPRSMWPSSATAVHSTSYSPSTSGAVRRQRHRVAVDRSGGRDLVATRAVAQLRAALADERPR